MQRLVILGIVGLMAFMLGASHALADGGGAAKTVAHCAAEYNIPPSDDQIFFVTGPEGQGVGGPFHIPGVGRVVFGTGTAVLTPSGRANIVCQGTAPGGHPPVSISTQCSYLPNPRTTPALPPVFAGRGTIVVTPDHNVTLTCHVAGLP